MSTKQPDDAVHLLREVNDRIRALANGSGPSRFLCECGDPGCRQTVMLTTGAFDARRSAGRLAAVLAHPRA